MKCLFCVIAMSLACGCGPDQPLGTSPAQSAPPATPEPAAPPPAVATPNLDGPITFKKYVGRVGDRVRVTFEAKFTETSKYDLFPTPTTRSHDTKITHTTEVLEVASDGTPSKLRRRFDLFQEIRNNAVEKGPLEGRAVLIHMSAGKTQFTFENNPLEKVPYSPLFHGEFDTRPACNDFDTYFPTAPARVKDSWTTREQLLAWEGKTIEFDLERVNATATFTDLAVVDGRLVATLSGKSIAPTLGLKGRPDRFSPGSHIEIVWKAKGCIDGASPDHVSETTYRIQMNLPNATLTTVETSTQTTQRLNNDSDRGSSNGSQPAIGPAANPSNRGE